MRWADWLENLPKVVVLIHTPVIIDGNSAYFNSTRRRRRRLYININASIISFFPLADSHSLFFLSFFLFSIQQWYHFGARMPRLSWQTDLRAGNRVACTDTRKKREPRPKRSARRRRPMCLHQLLHQVSKEKKRTKKTTKNQTILPSNAFL